MSNAALVESAWCRGLAPEPALTVSEWADAHRVLPPQSAEPGRWRTSRVPYLREIMDALSVSHPAERVVFQAGAQVGKTEAGLNWLGYMMHHAPGLCMMVQPSVDAVRRNTVTRIDPLIEHSPVLRSLVAEKKSRDTGNSMLRKAFPGGELVMTGAQSGIGLRSIPVRFLFMDEVDAYPADVDDEGDPVALAIQRTVTFRGRRKVYMVSTPTLRGFSRIEAAYLESDQRRYVVPCPECNQLHPLEWKQIRWPEGERHRAYRVCPECGGIAEEHDKAGMLARGEWRATAEGDGLTVGFHLSSLYSPFETWGEIAVEHGKVHRDPARLKTWINTKLGETWEERDGEGIDAVGLPARREDLSGPLPAWVVVLTAGVDVQVDRIECTVFAWGEGERCAVLSHTVLWGDPAGPQVWHDLGNLLSRTYPHELDIPDLPIRAACVDTGGAHTLASYAWLRDKQKRRWWGVKGSSTPGAPLWPKRPANNTKGRFPVFVIGTNTAKETIYARLKNVEPGPGFIHFDKSLTDNYFLQLTAEKVRTRYSKGHPVREWHLTDGKRNEALDCAVYGLAALHGLRSMGFDLDREAAGLIGLPPRKATQQLHRDVIVKPKSSPMAPIRSNYITGGY